MTRFVRGLVVATVSALGGCTTLGMVLNLPASPAGRPIDYLGDDVARLVFAIDVPRSLQLVEQASIFSLDLTTSRGARHIKARLVLADGDQIDENLPAPADGRTYYLLGFSESDQAAIRDAQAWAKAQGAEQQGIEVPRIISVVMPKFCAISPIDPQSTKISVLAELPDGPPLLPLAAQQPLSMVPGLGDAPLPACAG